MRGSAKRRHTIEQIIEVKLNPQLGNGVVIIQISVIVLFCDVSKSVHFPDSLNAPKGHRISINLVQRCLPREALRHGQLFEAF